MYLFLHHFNLKTKASILLLTFLNHPDC